MSGRRTVSDDNMKKPPHTLERRLLDALARHEMLRRGERILVAVSGGSDSVALLRLLHSLAADLGVELHVAHLDHGWRGEAAAKDARFVQRLARRLGLPCTLGRLEPGAAAAAGRRLSREARARVARLAWLRETARTVGATRIAVGHTLDDQAESFFLALLRGSGTLGLSGTWPVVDGLFIRPVLDLRRAELRDWLKRAGQRFREDASNRDPAYTRNRVRRRLIPFLEREFTPAATRLVARAADLLRAEEIFLSGLAEGTYELMAQAGPDGVAIDAAALHGLPLSFRRRIVRRAIRQARGHLRGIEARHVESALTLTHGPGAAAVDLPGGLRASRRGGALLFRVGAPAPTAFRPRAATPDAVAATAGGSEVCEGLCPVPGRVSLPALDLRLRARIVPRDQFDRRPDRAYACLDADLTPGPLLVRGRRPGDRFRPLGSGGSRKVKAFLIDRKVPRDQRARIPIVLSGERIAWVVGHQIDERFKMTPATRRVLVLEREIR